MHQSECHDGNVLTPSCEICFPMLLLLRDWQLSQTEPTSGGSYDGFHCQICYRCARTCVYEALLNPSDGCFEQTVQGALFHELTG